MSNRKIINTVNAPQAIGPYSQAIKINNLLFTSGQIPYCQIQVKLFQIIFQNKLSNV